MSDNMAEDIDRGEAFLEHYGTKGMKWGVRKDTIKGARKAVRSEKKGAKKDYKKGNTTKEERKARVSDARRSETGHTARTLTRGEQAATAIFIAPTFPVAILANVAYSQANNFSGKKITGTSNKDASLKNRPGRRQY